MPMCTYLGDDQHTAPTSDQELNTLLAEVRSATGEDWRIGEHESLRLVPFRGTRVKRTYTLYAHVSGGEFQVLNLRGNTVGHVEAFLFGILAGRKPIEALEKTHASDLDALLETIDERDRAEEWADKLANAIGGDAIGEHSSANNPWQNALDILAQQDAGGQG